MSFYVNMEEMGREISFKSRTVHECTAIRINRYPHPAAQKGVELAEMHDKMRISEEKANLALRDNDNLRLRFREVSSDLQQCRHEREMYKQQLDQNEELKHELDFRRKRMDSISATIGKTLKGDIGELVNLNVILEIKSKEAEDYFQKAQNLEIKVKQVKTESREKNGQLEELQEKCRQMEIEREEMRIRNLHLTSRCQDLQNENMTYSLIIKENK